MKKIKRDLLECIGSESKPEWKLGLQFKY